MAASDEPGRRQRLADLIAEQPEELRAILEDAARPRGPSDPKRHHHVPQFYLKRFAQKDGPAHRIATVPLDTPDRARVGSVADTAVISEFYTVVNEDDADSLVVERLLARVEAESKAPLERLAAGVLFPPQPLDRHQLSLFFALQWARGPHIRRAMEAAADIATKMQMSVVATEESVRRQLKERDGADPSREEVAAVLDWIRDERRWESALPQNEFVAMMLDHALTVAPKLFQRYWTVVRYPEDGLVICDAPLALYVHPENREPFRGVGIGTADEVNVPLDRRTLLVMHHDGAIGNRVIDAPGQDVDDCNQLLVSGARQEVYAHPDDVWRLRRVELPDPEAPLFQLHGGAWLGALPDGINSPPERRRPRRYSASRRSAPPDGDNRSRQM